MTMEQVAFQKTFKRIFEYEMEKRNSFFYIHEVTRHKMRKIFRIKSLKAPIKAEKVMWKNIHVELEEELAQVTATSLGVHDDVIDALADAWDVQIEMCEDMQVKKVEINSFEWMVENNLLPTVEEEELITLY